MVQHVLTSPDQVAEFMSGLTKSAVEQAKNGKPVVIELKQKTEEVRRDGALVDLVYMGHDTTIKLGI